jgi:cyclopropane fatty-acyl-phospholipid synthase-like methyltransferase
MYRPIDSLATLFCVPSQPKMTLSQYQAQYAALRGRLKDIGWISEGYVQDRGPGAGGPCYQWTRKVKGKTVSVALSKEQFQWLQAAIAQWREVQRTLREMQRLSRQVLFETVPHPPRRKRLGKKTLGLM